MQCFTRLILISAALSLSVAENAHGQRYWALMRDGNTQTGDQLKNLDDPTQPVTLDGRKLRDANLTVRTIRDTKLSLARPRAFLEMVNGDVLIGVVLAAVTGEQAVPLPDHLVVADVRHTGNVRVSLDWIRRIVTTNRTRPEYTPNYLRLANGGDIQCRSIRWTQTGIQALTDAEVVTAAFEQIAELHVPQPQPQAWLPLYPGAVWLADEGPPVVRIVTQAGQAITYPVSMVTKDFDRKLVGGRSSSAHTLFSTRPPWALDSILIDPEEIAWQTYFDAGEVPLSILPVIDAETKAGLHHYPWNRDRNVQGGLLHSGEIASELGIGMHAYTRLTFELPPSVKSFSSRVGLNRHVGVGGCVHCRIWRDNPTGTPLWERRFLRGADGVQDVGPLDISNAKRLVLEVDFADAGRPQGADPLDLRDLVDWLSPIVRVDPVKESSEPLTLVIPEIAGWTISPEQLQHIQLRPFWIKRDNQWGTAIVTGSKPLVLSRQVHVTLDSAWLEVSATCDDIGDTRTVWVNANGEKVNSLGRGNLGTHSRYKFAKRAYSLSDYVGETISVEVVADAHKRSSGELGGVAWDWLRPRPLIRNLPADGKPIRPDIPLTSLSPTNAMCGQKPIKLLPGKLSGGDALNVRNWPFKDGYGVPSGSEIAYPLDPSWQTFVAVIGLAEGSYSAGPYQILLDEQPHWTSSQTYAREDQGEQISISIPPGHKTITLKLLGDDSIGAWADAGFLK